MGGDAATDASDTVERPIVESYEGTGVPRTNIDLGSWHGDCALFSPDGGPPRPARGPFWHATPNHCAELR